MSKRIRKVSYVKNFDEILDTSAFFFLVENLFITEKKKKNGRKGYGKFSMHAKVPLYYKQ